MTKLLDQYGTDSQSLWQTIKKGTPAAMNTLKFMGRSAYAFLLLGIAVGTGHAEILIQSGRQFAQGGQDAVNGFTAEVRASVAEFRNDHVDWPALTAQMETLTGEPFPDLDDPDTAALHDYLHRYFPS
jgi:hypothetical protein